MEVKNIFITKGYDIADSEQENEGSHFMQTLNDEGNEICKSSAGLFNILNAKFKPQHNETNLLLQYCQAYQIQK